MTKRAKARRHQIATMVASLGDVSVEELAAHVDASVETVRRDLTVLEDAGELLKVHGGAKRLPRTEGRFHERMRENRAGKEAIARKLADWLPPDQMIFMDTGSTSLIAAEALAKRAGLKVVTNSLKIAGLLAAETRGPKVYMLGGWVEGDNGETVGSAVIAEIDKFNADYAVLTVGALDPTSGACDFDFDEAEVARAMTRRAAKTVVLADGSKFNRVAAYPVCALTDIDVLISDAPPEVVLHTALETASVQRI